MNKYAHLAPPKPAPDFWKYWGCERKRRYPTRYDAVAMIRILQKLLAIYQCTFCGGYHLTKNKKVLYRDMGISSKPGTGDEGKTKQRGNEYGERNTE